MLVVVAGRADVRARELVDRWPGAGLLTCGDLSTVGWRYLEGDPEGSVAVVGGRPVVAGEITGVLTRLTYVPERELAGISREDRPYVAQEMAAFLRCWLASLDRPVLNRPDGACLSGPGWYREQWVDAAARLGIPVRPVRRHAVLGGAAPEDEPSAHTLTATVVGDRCLGTVDGALAGHALRLARSARVELLSVRFAETAAGPELLDADPCPAISSPEVADAVFEHLGGRC